ncbi:MAG TPA: hypothetical protein VFA52_03300 [Candidatus Paceibacterota bacterium]|nr:hypothetical protein [Candidatus Paceibacterota bacterium]
MKIHVLFIDRSAIRYDALLRSAEEVLNKIGFDYRYIWLLDDNSIKGDIDHVLSTHQPFAVVIMHENMTTTGYDVASLIQSLTLFYRQLPKPTIFLVGGTKWRIQSEELKNKYEGRFQTMAEYDLPNLFCEFLQKLPAN